MREVAEETERHNCREWGEGPRPPEDICARHTGTQFEHDVEQHRRWQDREQYEPLGASHIGQRERDDNESLSRQFGLFDGECNREDGEGERRYGRVLAHQHPREDEAGQEEGREPAATRLHHGETTRFAQRYTGTAVREISIALISFTRSNVVDIVCTSHAGAIRIG